MADSATAEAAGGVRRETPIPKGRLTGFAAGATVGVAIAAGLTSGVAAGDVTPRSKQPAAAPVSESAMPAPQLLPQLPKLQRLGAAAARSKQPAAVVTEAVSSPPAAVPPAEPPPASPPALAAPPPAAPPPPAARPPPAAPPEAAASCALLWRLVRSFDCRSNALRRPSASRLTELAAAGGAFVVIGLATGVVTGAAAATAAAGVALGSAVACALLLPAALSAARLRLTSKDSVRRGMPNPSRQIFLGKAATLGSTASRNGAADRAERAQLAVSMQAAMQEALPAGRPPSVNRWTPLVAGMYLELCGGSALC